MATNELHYDVNAGKIEWDDDVQDYTRNYKYCDSFATLEEAIVAYDVCAGYAFRELLYIPPSGNRYTVATFDSIISVRKDTL